MVLLVQSPRLKRREALSHHAKHHVGVRLSEERLHGVAAGRIPYDDVNVRVLSEDIPARQTDLRGGDDGAEEHAAGVHEGDAAFVATGVNCEDRLHWA